jgi:hypothetical protein
MRDVGRADKADRTDGRMIEDRVDHFLVAVDHLEDALRQAGFQNSSARRLGTDGSRSLGFRMKALPTAIATAPIHSGIIAGKLNGCDPGADAKRLAHRLNIDARPCALRIFALQHMRDAAAEFDHFKPALDVALAVGDHLAVLGARAYAPARPYVFRPAP